MKTFQSRFSSALKKSRFHTLRRTCDADLEQGKRDGAPQQRARHPALVGFEVRPGEVHETAEEPGWRFVEEVVGLLAVLADGNVLTVHGHLGTAARREGST